MNLLGKLTGRPQVQSSRVGNRAFLEAAMAAAALVVCADGGISAQRRRAIVETLAQLDGFAAHEMPVAIELFDLFAQRIHNRPEEGRAHARKVLQAAACDSAMAREVLWIGHVVRRDHGRASPAEMRQLEEISRLLGVAVPELREDSFIELGEGRGRPFIITLGNEKGGTGKSTIAMHMTVALMKLGYSVGAIDLDGHQGTLTRYLANREAFARTAGAALVIPRHRRIEAAVAAERIRACCEDSLRLREALVDLADCQVVIIDTPGSDTHLARLGHANADMLITPLNDTFLDIDVLARIDCRRREVLAPSAYCRMVMDLNERRVAGGRATIDWIVMRNRLTHIHTHNKREIAGLLRQLAERVGFRLVSGFGERVIFHELFLTGMTLLDLPTEAAEGDGNPSHRHARQEFRALLEGVGVPEIAA